MMAAVSVVNSLPKVLIPPATERCQLSRQDELKYVAFHFTDYLVRNKHIRKPAVISKNKLVELYINYQPSYPSHIKSSEIIEALREAKLLKRRRVAAGGDNNNIEFKDQIFHSENQSSSAENKEEVMKPRFRILTNQNYTFKNKLSKDPELVGLECLLCRTKFDNQTALMEHCSTRSHFLKKTYRDNRTSFLKRVDDLEVENAREFNFTIHQECKEQIVFRNVAEKELEIKFHSIESLVDIPYLTILHDAPLSIKNGESFVVTLKAGFNMYDAKKYPMVVEISLDDGGQFIDLLLEPKYVVLDEELRCLEATGPYEPMARNYEPVYDLPVISGIPVPRPKGEMMVSKTALIAHEIPTPLRKLLNHGFKKFSGMSEMDNSKLKEVRNLLCNDDQTQVLHNTCALTPQNYVSRFRHLMWIEEHQMEKDIHGYNLKEVQMTQEKIRLGFLGLEVPGLLEGRPSIIRGDSVFIRKQNDNVKYEGVVHLVKQSKLYVSPNRTFLDKYHGEKVDVEFSFGRYCLKICHRALDQIYKRNVSKVLFPSKFGMKKETPEVALRPFFNQQIKNNDQQKQAVINIVNNTAFPAPYVIFGPPGTGKTATMVESVMQIWSLFPSKKICVCAPSNWAADVLAERLLISIPPSNILRLYSPNRGDVPENLRNCSNYDTHGKELYLPPEATIRNKKVVIMTPIMAGRLISAGFSGGHFDYLFVDEAGHAIEMEMIVPLIGLLTKEKDPELVGSLVLAGDPKQLGPIVRSSLAINLGFGMSFLERLVIYNQLYQKDEHLKGYNPDVMVKLIKNYRSHSVILKVPNDLFYDGQLLTEGPVDKITCACRWEELPTRNFPMIFHGVKGLEDRERNSPSYFNRLEIQIVTNYVEKLMTTRLSGLKVTEKDIGIIAPYRKQVQKIRQFLNNKRYPNIDVASVEEFQGQEKLIIIISTVRSRFEYVASDYQFGLGFLRSEKRFNVAVTRAKALLIIIGNPDVLQCDPRWRTLMEYCSANNSYRGDKPADKIEEDFDVNKKLKMDLSSLVKSADDCPIDEKPGFFRDE